MYENIKVNKVIGWRRDGQSAGLAPVFTPTTPRVDGRWLPTSLGILKRIHVPNDAMHPGYRALSTHAPNVLKMIQGAQASRTDSEYERYEEEFCGFVDQWMEAFGRKRDSTVRDSTIYSLLAPIYAMPEVIERIYSKPVLYNLLPKMVLGTVLETGQYLQFEDHMPAVSHSWEVETLAQTAQWSGSTTVGTVPLKPILVGVKQTMREREQHEEMRGKMGAPSWDLWGRKMEKSSQAALNRAGQIVAWGDAELGLTGLIDPNNGVTAVNANYNTGTGLTDYATFSAQIDAQAAQVNYQDELVGDTIILDEQSFRSLSKELISNTGDSGDSVLKRIFDNAADISQILKARELGNITAEITTETPKVGATEAAKLGGGYFAGGTYHRCMVITKMDETVQAAIEGMPLSVEGLEPQYGGDVAAVRMSTGGCKIFRPEVPRIVYI